MAKKNVIVVSLGNSGSGAVFDYLRSRKDLSHSNISNF